jgi:hypothetical protein
MASSEISRSVKSPAKIASRLFWLWATVPAIFFLVAGLLFIPLAGFEADEVMFVDALWHPQSIRATCSVFHHRFPCMLMSYLGALKSWLYAPILAVFDISQWSVRVPVVILASVTIVLGALLMRRIAGNLGAAVFAWLIATDVTFLITGVFDWGPVVIQNLLLVASLLVFERWWHKRSNWLLFWGSVLIGLALWDKALFVWNLSGMVVALLLLNGLNVLRAFQWKRVGVIVAGLVLGAYPLIQFNAKYRLETFSGNTHLTLKEVPGKTAYVELAINGLAAEGGFADNRNPKPAASQSAFDGFVFNLLKRDLAGVSSWRLALLLIGVPVGLVAADSLRRRWILFFILSALIAWFQSILTVNAGGSIHHTVLVWPLMYFAIAVSLAAIADSSFFPIATRFAKPAIILILAIFTLRGMETIGISYANFVGYSRDSRWTDADEALSIYLLNKGVTNVIVTDWGIDSVLSTRSNERLSVLNEFFELASGRFDKSRFLACKAPQCAIVGHVKDECILVATCAAIDTLYRTNGVTKVDPQVIRDSSGAPVFSVFHFQPAQ